MITINQGKPSSPYFGVIQTEDAGLLKIGHTVTCLHPRKQTKTIGRVHSVFTYRWEEFSDSMFLILFGFTVAEYRTAICISMPEFMDTQIVKVFILLELKQS